MGNIGIGLVAPDLSLHRFEVQVHIVPSWLASRKVLGSHPVVSGVTGEQALSMY